MIQSKQKTYLDYLECIKNHKDIGNAWTLKVSLVTKRDYEKRPGKVGRTCILCDILKCSTLSQITEKSWYSLPERLLKLCLKHCLFGEHYIVSWLVHRNLNSQLYKEQCITPGDTAVLHSLVCLSCCLPCIICMTQQRYNFVMITKDQPTLPFRNKLKIIALYRHDLVAN